MPDPRGALSFTIDLRTTILLSAVSAGLMAAILYAAHRSFPPSLKGLGHWAAGLFLGFPIALLFRLRGVAPDWLTITVANAGLYVAVCLQVIGLELFFGRRTRWSVLIAGGVAMSAALAWWTYVEPNFQLRVAACTFTTTCLHIRMVQLVFRYSARSAASGIFLASLLIETLILAARCVTALIPIMIGNDLFADSRMHAIYLISDNLMTLCQPVGFLLMAFRQLQDELERLSSLDPLTKILNRRAFLATCAREHARLQRHGQPLSFLAVDLDHFKRINDTHGHAVGDQVLVYFADKVAATLREVDVIGRFGGEEFIVMLAETPLILAGGAAERIRAAIAVGLPEGLPAFTISMGLASLENPQETVESALLRADRALYRAKENGRDRLEFAKPISSALSLSSHG
jgi:diguanylate cyclase (GGDEF)-like protein